MALFESIWKGQRRNLVRQDNACLFPLRKGKRFDLRERQIRKRFLCAVPNAIQIMPIEHHLQNIIVNDFDPAFMVIRSEEHTSELQSLMRISYAVFCLKKKNKTETKIESLQRHKHKT